MTDDQAELTTRLPELPGWTGEGYEWMQQLAHGWYSVSAWGEQGWDLGDWPLVIVAHYDSPDLYGQAVYVEGDLEITAYPSREERDRAASSTAVKLWRWNERGPSLPPVDSAQPEPYFPPYFRPRA